MIYQPYLTKTQTKKHDNFRRPLATAFYAQLEEEYESGILKSDQTINYEEKLATVLFVVDLGPDCYVDSTRFPHGAWCKRGDFIIVRPNAGTRLLIHGREFRMINDDTVEAVVMDPRGIKRA